MERPIAGTKTTYTVRIRICKNCDCVISEIGLCDRECMHDGLHNEDTFFYAVYERTLVDVFLRDEGVK